MNFFTRKNRNYELPANKYKEETMRKEELTGTLGLSMATASKEKIHSGVWVKLKAILSEIIIKRVIDIFFRGQKKQTVHILHVGKTGGTAVDCALKSNLTTKKYRIKLQDHIFRLNDVPEGDKFVFFVRDPIKRFVSGFYSRQRKGAPLYNVPWSPDEEEAFRLFNIPNELALAVSFEDKKKQENAVKAMKSIVHVNSSYWDWFIDEAYFQSRLPDLLFIGFQESLNDSFAMLKKILELPDELKLPDDDLKAHKAPRRLDKHLDDQAVGNLMDWYKKDYAFFELCMQLAKEVNGTHK